MRTENRSADMVRLAFRKGYRVTDDGHVISAHGKTRKLTLKKRQPKDPGYLAFNMKIPGSRNAHPIKVHQLAAFQKFGEKLFEVACVRHLDGNSLNNSPDNLALGSHGDNAMDRSPEARKTHAALAAAANIKYDWPAIEADHAAGLGYKKLRQKYGVRSGTLSAHFQKTPGWRTPVPADQYDWGAIKQHLRETRCSYTGISRIFGCSTRACQRRLGPRRDFLN